MPAIPISDNLWCYLCLAEQRSSHSPPPLLASKEAFIQLYDFGEAVWVCCGLQLTQFSQGNTSCKMSSVYWENDKTIFKLFALPHNPRIAIDWIQDLLVAETSLVQLLWHDYTVTGLHPNECTESALAFCIFFLFCRQKEHACHYYVRQSFPNFLNWQLP